MTKTNFETYLRTNLSNINFSSNDEVVQQIAYGRRFAYNQILLDIDNFLTCYETNEVRFTLPQNRSKVFLEAMCYTFDKTILTLDERSNR